MSREEMVLWRQVFVERLEAATGSEDCAKWATAAVILFREAQLAMSLPTPKVGP